MKIFALDDVQQHLTIYNKMFGAIGFLTPGKLLDAMIHDQPDLFLCDLVMPNFDGWVMIRAARELCPKMPIIVATSKCDISQKQLATQLGCLFWCKDGNYRSLRDMITEVEQSCIELVKK